MHYKKLKDMDNKKLNYLTLLWAVVENGSDPSLIETEEEAKLWGEVIFKSHLRTITDEAEFAIAKNKLGFSKEDNVKRIFAFCNGNSGCFV